MPKPLRLTSRAWSTRLLSDERAVVERPARKRPRPHVASDYRADLERGIVKALVRGDERAAAGLRLALARMGAEQQ